jgi:sulfur carrier protein
MDIVINGQARQVDDGLCLADAVTLLAPAASGVAAAVNGAVVTRARWASVTLSPGDVVEVVTAVQGG